MKEIREKRESKKMINVIEMGRIMKWEE